MSFVHPLSLESTVKGAMFQSEHETTPDECGGDIKVNMNCYSDDVVTVDSIIITIGDQHLCYNTLVRIMKQANSFVCACNEYNRSK